METNFNFKSQPATSIEQSEKLLSLGLKKETADMCWTKMARISGTFYVLELAPINMVSWRHTPAWSLHRLIKIAALCPCEIYPKDNVFDEIIYDIEEAIKEGYFNKEYLVNQAEIEEHCKGVLEYLDYIRGDE